ncbi:MAG: hypothetical protein H0T79_20180, partial [Deltaproteobacteria bacterium]|nr:hypothetical protein [Deltaproteobacteria bacterium]
MSAAAPPKPASKTPMPGDRGHKRSWKNLLINKRYQLQFTLFMVGLAALLMLALGWRVMSKANEATTVGKVHVLGEACPPIPALSLDQAPAMEPAVDEPDEPPAADVGSGSATGSAGSGAGSAATPSIGQSEALVEVVAQWCS